MAAVLIDRSYRKQWFPHNRHPRNERTQIAIHTESNFFFSYFTKNLPVFTPSNPLSASVSFNREANAMPARLHELTPDQVVLAGATPEAFLAFKQSLLNSLHPEGELELLFAESIVAAEWGLRGCRLAEASLATEKHPDPLCNENVHPALRLIDATIRRHERSIERNLKLLRELQSEREFRRLAAHPAAAAAAAPLANTARTRRAFFAEESLKSRLDRINLKSALDQFLNQPPPGSSVTFDRFSDK